MQVARVSCERALLVSAHLEQLVYTGSEMENFGVKNIEKNRFQQMNESLTKSMVKRSEYWWGLGVSRLVKW